ncbi:hypothetical protein [Rubricoccus marinus]|uniref:Uncharacterized protein n=1 Tax=Rubricoccus marinus TaxID=716817 RepID=A0A259U384_9BACT|nr:hypothetical protein [Rubricoccus marinus]OZC04485.1 hypothetical protein BSZ36_16790 [Rubricoccus marinus]
MPSPSVPTHLLKAAVALAAAGVLASLGVHVASLNGLAGSTALGLTVSVWIGASFAPVIGALIQRSEKEIGPLVSDESTPNPFEFLPRALQLNGWMLRFLPIRERIVFGLLLAYTAVWMVRGIANVVSEPDAAGFPLPMVSAFWLYFSGFSMLFGRRLLALRSADA